MLLLNFKKTENAPLFIIIVIMLTCTRTKKIEGFKNFYAESMECSKQHK